MFEESRVIKVDPLQEFNGLAATLSHGSNLTDSHGEEDKAFRPF